MLSLMSSQAHLYTVGIFLAPAKMRTQMQAIKINTKSIDQLTNNINFVLCRTLDIIAPLKRKVCSKKLATWYNDHTHALKKASHQLERKWRSTKLQVFFHAWKDSLLSYKHALSTARPSYFSTLIENRNNPRHLFNTVPRLTKNHVDPCVSIPFSSNDYEFL